jgi:Ca2+-binding RTX toxin-like protein
MTTLFGSIYGPNGGVDMPNWDLTPLQTGEITAFSGDSVTIRAGDQTYFLTGHDFAYTIDGGTVSLAAGTITGLTVEPYPPPPTASPFPTYDYHLADFQLDVGAFNGFIAANDVAGYERALFSGDDHLQGSFHDDHLLGLRGNDHLDGSGGDDALDGGRGNDVVIGDAGADVLTGGRGTDVFVFRAAAESSGGVYDTLADFSAADDLLVVPHAVSAIDHARNARCDSLDQIDDTLAAAADGRHLGAHDAVIVHITFNEPQPGTPLAPETYLVVDVNGVAGYQAGEDLAIRIADPRHLHLGIDDFLSPAVG